MRRLKDKRRILGGPRPAKPAIKPRLMNLKIGAAYVSAKGTSLRMRWGRDPVFMVLEVPERCTSLSIVKVIGPNGLLLVTAGELRPAVDTSETAEATE